MVSQKGTARETQSNSEGGLSKGFFDTRACSRKSKLQSSMGRMKVLGKMEEILTQSHSSVVASLRG